MHELISLWMSWVQDWGYAGVIVLMAMATIFGNIMTIEDVPGTIARAILGGNLAAGSTITVDVENGELVCR